MREERYSVSFAVHLMWEESAGVLRRMVGRCLDLSPSGMKIEMRDLLKKDTPVLVMSEEFGRMGHASVRFCQRDRMRCLIGLKFGTAFALGDPARQKILEKVHAPQDPATISEDITEQAV
jgi:hypothetical protein